jgi:hypothetical protein
MFTKNIFKDKDTVADLVSNILEADYKVKKEELKGNQHKIDMNKNNKIDAHDFKLLRSKGTQKEEVEQIDEIGDTPAGKRALRAVQNRAVDTMSDPSKSSKQVNKAVGAGVSAGNRLHGFGHDRMKKNTVMGRDALRKQLGVKEEVEQIDEIGDKPITISRLVPSEHGRMNVKHHDGRHLGVITHNKSQNTWSAVSTANGYQEKGNLNGKIAAHDWIRKTHNMPSFKDLVRKEEVEQVEERTLTPGETSEKERIVKGMKKSLSGFKQRYGERAKSVMYATATKAAKKD